jgi:hypothetical protein
MSLAFTAHIESCSLCYYSPQSMTTASAVTEAGDRANLPRRLGGYIHLKTNYSLSSPTKTDYCLLSRVQQNQPLLITSYDGLSLACLGHQDCGSPHGASGNIVFIHPEHAGFNVFSTGFPSLDRALQRNTLRSQTPRHLRGPWPTCKPLLRLRGS